MAEVNGNNGFIFYLFIVFTILVTLVAFLRLVVRTRSKASFAADDVWLLLSIVFFYVYQGLSLWGQYMS